MQFNYFIWVGKYGTLSICTQRGPDKKEVLTWILHLTGLCNDDTNLITHESPGPGKNSLSPKVNLKSKCFVTN